MGLFAIIRGSIMLKQPGIFAKPVLTAAWILFSVTACPDLTRAADRLGHAATDTPQIVPPQAIIAAAQRLKLPLESIKQQGDQWVACVAGPGLEASCYVLGPTSSAKSGSVMGRNAPDRSVPGSAAERAKLTQLDHLQVGDVLLVQQYGQPLRQATLAPTATISGAPAAAPARVIGSDLSSIGRFVTVGANDYSFQLNTGAEARVSVRDRDSGLAIDTLPRFRRESPWLVRTRDFQLVRQYIDAHPSEPFVVLVTVPALCEPCRQMDHIVHEAFAGAQPPSSAAPVKTFILEYFDFDAAEREVLGQNALFPTTMIYRAGLEPRRSIFRTIGSTGGYSHDAFSRTLGAKLKRGAPHTVTRGLISKDLLLQLVRPQ